MHATKLKIQAEQGDGSNQSKLKKEKVQLSTMFFHAHGRKYPKNRVLGRIEKYWRTHQEYFCLQLLRKPV